MSTRDIPGKLTTGSGTTLIEYEILLARGRPTPYRPLFRKVFPEFQDVPGVEGKVSGDPRIRYWHIDRFDGGEGEDLWKPGLYRYDQSSNVSPKQVGDGLVLGAERTLTVDDAGTPATFANARRFGLAQGKLWTVEDNTIHDWQPSSEDWEDTGTATGASGSDATCLVDLDGSSVLVGLQNNTIRKVTPGGANSEYYSAANWGSYDPVLRVFNGVVYGLAADDLYEITAANTRTARADLSGASDNYLTNDLDYTYNRMSTSDVGPIWFQRLDNGQTILWEYNVADDTDYRTGKLPVDFAHPYSIYWANGYTFVGFRYASAHDQVGDAYLYYQRGIQRGVAGPFRNISASSASMPIWIAGVIGDDLICYFDGAVWAYNLTSGGISMVGASATTEATRDNVMDAITFGKEVFISNTSNTYQCERFDRKAYSTDTATWDSGRYDFGYLGIDKTLLDVTVVTEPLPTNTTLSLSVSVEGGSFSAVTGTYTGDGSTTSYTWTVSTSTSSTVGRDFELRLTFASTDSSVTPTVRSITARAIAAETQGYWELELDAGSVLTSLGDGPRSSDTLANLRTLATYSGVVKFVNPWEKEDWDDPASFDVVIEAVDMPEADPEFEPFITVLLRESAYG